MIKVQWDDRTLAFVERTPAFVPKWEDAFYTQLPSFIAKEAMAYMKPLMHVRPWYTGALEDSLTAKVTNTGEGFDIEFESLFYGMYMDVGNDGPAFSGGQMLASTYGYRAFPAKDGNDGSTVFMPAIRPMGSTTPGAPTHFSEKTLDYLANGPAMELTLSSMTRFLMGVAL